MKVLLKYLALLLAFMMIFTVCSCTLYGGDTTWVYEIDGEKIPAGVYLYYQQVAYGLAEQKIAEETAAASSQDGSESSAASSSVPFADKTIEGIPSAEWLQNEVLNLCKRYVTVQKEFTALGLSVSEAELKNTRDTAAKNYETNEAQIKVYSTFGIGLESFKNVSLSDVYSTTLFSKYFGAGGEYEVPEDELKAYYAENYAAAVIYTVPVSEDTDLKILDVNLDKLIDNLNSTPDGFSAAIMEFESTVPEELRSDYTSGLSEDTFTALIDKSNSNSSVPALVSNAVWETEGYGKYVRINVSDTQIYIVARRDVLADSLSVYFAIYGSSLLYEFKSEDYAAALDEKGAGLSVTENSKALRRYSLGQMEKNIAAVNSAYAANYAY
ncbi:MAG: hypothetical protein LBC56_03705 [Oscillospiraceae bacterium]|jgi:hypothetical protein|nr:hypothetical protein [Oscillospiraceae bacterium]